MGGGTSPTAPEHPPHEVLIVEDDESTAEAMAFHMRAAGLERGRGERRARRPARLRSGRPTPWCWT